MEVELLKMMIEKIETDEIDVEVEEQQKTRRKATGRGSRRKNHFKRQAELEDLYSLTDAVCDVRRDGNPIAYLHRGSYWGRAYFNKLENRKSRRDGRKTSRCYDVSDISEAT